MRRSSWLSGSRRNNVERESSGPVSEKKGFSVVAPMSTSRPSSTCGSSASCCVRLKRCTSSRKRIVPRPCSPMRARARSATSRTSFTPAVTADSGSNAFSVAPATRRAIVVLPVPGGPQRITDDSRSASMSTRSGLPDPRRCSWPTTSSRERGRSRAASGARPCSRSATAAEKRSSGKAHMVRPLAGSRPFACRSWRPCQPPGVAGAYSLKWAWRSRRFFQLVGAGDGARTRHPYRSRSISSSKSPSKTSTRAPTGWPSNCWGVAARPRTSPRKHSPGRSCTGARSTPTPKRGWFEWPATSPSTRGGAAGGSSTGLLPRHTLPGPTVRADRPPPRARAACRDANGRCSCLRFLADLPEADRRRGARLLGRVGEGPCEPRARSTARIHGR